MSSFAIYCTVISIHASLAQKRKRRKKKEDKFRRKVVKIKKLRFDKSVDYHKRACNRSLEQTKRDLEHLFGVAKLPSFNKIRKDDDDHEMEDHESLKGLDVSKAFLDYLQEERQKISSGIIDLEVTGESMSLRRQKMEIPEIVFTNYEDDNEPLG